MPIRPDACGPRLGTRAMKGASVLTPIDTDPVPPMLAEIDGYALQWRVALKEMLGEHQAEMLRTFHRRARSQGVDGVFHRVGRKDGTVVPIDIRGVVVPLEPYGNGKITEVVPVTAPDHLHEANAGFPVRGISEHQELPNGR